MQSEFAERRWRQYMGQVKNKPKSDSGIQKEEKHAESKQFKQGIVIGIISSVVFAILSALFSNAAKLPVRMDNIEKNVKDLNSRIDTVESKFDQKIDETKSDIRGDIEGVGDDITRLENLILPFLHLKPSAEVQQQITYAYGEVNRVEQSGGLVLTSASVVAYNDHGAEYTANQLSDIKLLLPYHEGKQNVFFYGQFDEENRWDGDCLVNIYENALQTLFMKTENCLISSRRFQIQRQAAKRVGLSRKEPHRMTSVPGGPGITSETEITIKISNLTA